MHSLPVCSWRGEFRQERYYCRSAKFLWCARTGWRRRSAANAPTPTIRRRPLRLQRLPCVHLGGAASIGDGTSLFSCALHGRCSPAWDSAAPSEAAPRCIRCSDYLSRDPSHADSARMRDRANAHLAAVPDYPAGRYRGRGVVIAGGGERYFASLYVTILRSASPRLLATDPGLVLRTPR